MTSPNKRIAAEMRWFVGCSRDEEEEIVERLDNEFYYAKRFSCPLAELNFNLYTLEYEDLTAETIMLIGALYDLQDAEEIFSCINEGREQSNFPPIRDTSEIKSELKEIREEIRRTFQLKTKEIDDVAKLAAELANLVVGAKKINVIVEDFFIKIYKPYVENFVADNSKKFIYAAKNLEENPIETNFKIFSNELQKFIPVLKPLDEVAAVSNSVTNDISEKIFYRLRHVALNWHNEADLIDEPLRLTKILSESFTHIEKLKKIIDKDLKILEEIKSNNLRVKQVADCLERRFTLLKVIDKSIKLNNVANKNFEQVLKFLKQIDIVNEKPYKLLDTWKIFDKSLELSKPLEKFDKRLVVFALKPPSINFKSDDELPPDFEPLPAQNVDNLNFELEKRTSNSSGCVVFVIAIF